ncbi:hypothetical protein BDQ12DRAFT_668775 [Crucibulum laeve]|uniref:Uncharacterized protein n=1 Tax=Crucibulum laeve TaxID=68775 RepID=A0A5C3LRP6_9AGAR|nr:hypothetical protein BDQ12DRAFT_668775 [Crucibulum laeve]
METRWLNTIQSQNLLLLGAERNECEEVLSMANKEAILLNGYTEMRIYFSTANLYQWRMGENVLAIIERISKIWCPQLHIRHRFYSHEEGDLAIYLTTTSILLRLLSNEIRLLKLALLMDAIAFSRNIVPSTEGFIQTTQQEKKARRRGDVSYGPKIIQYIIDSNPSDPISSERRELYRDILSTNQIDQQGFASMLSYSFRKKFLYAPLDLSSAGFPLFTIMTNDPNSTDAAGTAETFIELLSRCSEQSSVKDMIESHVKILQVCILAITDPNPAEEHIYGWIHSCSYLGWFYAITSWLKHWKRIVVLDRDGEYVDAKPNAQFISRWMNIIHWEREIMPHHLRSCPLLNFGLDASELRDSYYIFRNHFSSRVRAADNPKLLSLIIGLLLLPPSVFGLPIEFLYDLPGESSRTLDEVLLMIRPFVKKETSASVGYENMVTLAPFSSDPWLVEEYKLGSDGYSFWMLHLLMHAADLCVYHLLDQYIAYIMLLLEYTLHSSALLKALNDATYVIQSALKQRREAIIDVDTDSDFFEKVSAWLEKGSSSPEILQRWNKRSRVIYDMIPNFEHGTGLIQCEHTSSQHMPL